MRTATILLALLIGSSALADEQYRLRQKVSTGGGGGGAFTTVTWTNETHTSGWPGFVGYLQWGGYDAVSAQIMHYAVLSTQAGIYSTHMFGYDVAGNAFTDLGGNAHAGDDCTDTWPTWPKDRHPVGQMAIDTLRNRMWLVGGVCQNIDQQDMYYWSLNANPLLDTWTKVTPAALPTDMNSAAMVYDADTDALLFFGPSSGSALTIWIYCPTGSLSGAQTTAGCGAPQTWTQITFSGGPFLGDSFPMVTYSNVLHKAVIFGGIDNSTSTNAVWTYTTATKTLAERCTAPCSPPDVGDQLTWAFVEIPASSTFFFHQARGTGSPKDWIFTMGASAAADVWTALTSVGSGPATDCVAVYNPSQQVVVLWSRNAGSGEPDVHQGVLK